MKHYEGSATREGKWWVVDVVDVGVTQGRTTGEALRMAQDLVCVMTGAAVEDVRVDVTFHPGGDTERLVKEALDKSAHAVQAQHKASRATRAAVRAVLDDGLSKQDAARILKLAPQRISQLTK